MTRFDSTQIPPSMLESLQLYILDGIRPGHFLTAVLSNDLAKACGRADETNLPLIPVYVRYLVNEAPSNCWGSDLTVGAWIMEHAKRRRLAETP